jgi:glycine oxidase
VETADVIVGGGGIIGLSVALELARNGFRVRVLERGRVMEEASWAAAGMLAGHDPEHPPELAELAELSFALYPEYLATVEQFSGRTLQLRTRGALITCGDEEGSLSGEDAQKRVPGLAIAGRRFCWRSEVSLDPRDLCTALPLAVAAAGVVLEQETEVLAIRGLTGSVEVTTSRGKLSAGAFVNCCGAWASKVQQLDLENQPASGVEPWKGQIFAVRLDPPTDLTCVLRTSEVYLVPRGGGLIVIGATVERAGFDRRVDPFTVERLHAQAAQIWPPIAAGRVVESWTGLRPGTSDFLPIIGNAGKAHCWVATGHFRNGILLAPVTGLVMRQLLQGTPPAVSLTAFAPGRLASDKVPSAAL